MRNPISYREVRFYPERCLENTSELLLGPKFDRGNLTWQTKQITVLA